MTSTPDARQKTKVPLLSFFYDRTRVGQTKKGLQYTKEATEIMEEVRDRMDPATRQAFDERLENILQLASKLRERSGRMPKFVYVWFLNPRRFLNESRELKEYSEISSAQVKYRAAWLSPAASQSPVLPAAAAAPTTPDAILSASPTLSGSTLTNDAPGGGISNSSEASPLDTFGDGERRAESTSTFPSLSRQSTISSVISTDPPPIARKPSTFLGRLSALRSPSTPSPRDSTTSPEDALAMLEKVEQLLEKSLRSHSSSDTLKMAMNETSRLKVTLGNTSSSEGDPSQFETTFSDAETILEISGEDDEDSTAPGAETGRVDSADAEANAGLARFWRSITMFPTLM